LFGWRGKRFRHRAVHGCPLQRLDSKALYSRLALPGYAERIRWDRVHLFWGDERCVPPDHLDSNYRMVLESLLSAIQIPAENVHPMSGEKKPPIAALQYEAQLKRFFKLTDGGLPRFDLILLGLGDDGHTASLFPGSRALTMRSILLWRIMLKN
jgi:6-phosphogluconolactonase